MHRAKTDEHDFSEHDERRDLRSRGDECRGRNRRALIRIRRPKMKWRSGDFEGESDQRHDDAGREQRLQSARRLVLSDRSEPGVPDMP